MSESQIKYTKRYKKVTNLTTGKKFGSIKEASQFYNVTWQTIAKVCNGQRLSAGKDPITKEKYKWEFTDDTIKKEV